MELARLGITDFIGVSFAGLREKQSQIIIDYVRETGCVPHSTVVGGQIRTSPSLAALANGTVGHSLDYDDMAISLIAHPSSFLAPAIFAVGERAGASGQDILAAYVIGYEVASQIGKPLIQSHYTQGWHSTATFGTLGAAAAVSWLLKLNSHQVRMALGIAASVAAGLRQNFGTMTKPLHAGMAAANGIQAAYLARGGFTSDENIIESPMGFAKVFGQKGKVDWTGVIESLGMPFLITSPQGLSIKPYPSCGFTHCAIDAAIAIKDAYDIDIQAIDEIELGVSPFDKKILIHHSPKTGLEAKFSLEYCVARALVADGVRLKHFTSESVAEPRVRGLAEKMIWVEKYPLPVMGTPEGFGTKSVAVKMKNGKNYTYEVPIAKGMPQNPLSSQEFNAKFRDCAAVYLDNDKVGKCASLLSMLKNLEFPVQGKRGFITDILSP